MGSKPTQCHIIIYILELRSLPLPKDVMEDEERGFLIPNMHININNKRWWQQRSTKNHPLSSIKTNKSLPGEVDLIAEFGPRDLTVREIHSSGAQPGAQTQPVMAGKMMQPLSFCSISFYTIGPIHPFSERIISVWMGRSQASSFSDSFFRRENKNTISYRNMLPPLSLNVELQWRPIE